MSDLVRKVNDFKFSINNDKQVSGAVLVFWPRPRSNISKLVLYLLKNSPKFTQILPKIVYIWPKIDQNMTKNYLNILIENWNCGIYSSSYRVIKWSEGCFKIWKIKGEVVILSTSSLYRIYHGIDFRHKTRVGNARIQYNKIIKNYQNLNNLISNDLFEVLVSKN